MVKLSVEQALAKAGSLLKQGQTAEAKALYEAVLQAFPNNKQAQQGLATLGGGQRSVAEQGPPQAVVNQLMSLYKQGQLDLVVEQAKTLTAQFPKAIALWNVLGASAAQVGQLDLAVQAFEQIIALRPNQAVAYFNMGNALKDQGKLDDAIEAYNEALSIKPDYEAALNNVVIALKAQGQAGEKKLKKVLEKYNRAQAVKAENANSYFNRALDLHQKGKLDEAIAAYTKAIAIKPDNALAYNNMGVALKNHGKLEEAIEAYNKSLAIKPDYAEAYSNMGVALKDQGKLDEAIGAYNKALAIKPDYAEAYNNQGNALQKQSKLEEALEAYNKALVIKPDYAQPYNNIGNALQEQGKLEKAVEAYKKSLSITPEYADASRNLVELPIGSVDEETILGLNEMFSISSSKIQDRSQRLFFEANLFTHRGKYEEAFKKFVEANRIKSNEIASIVENLTQNYDQVVDRIKCWTPRKLKPTENSLTKLFLLGPSRSGKSSLEKLMMRIPEVYPMYENISVNASDKTDRIGKNLDMATLFYRDEKGLLDDGYSFVTSTSPESMFHIDQLLDGLVNSFCVLVKRDRSDLEADIFTREYRKGNFYSYTHSSIQSYLDTYFVIWEEIKRKVPRRILEIEYEDISTKPSEVLEKINQFTGKKLTLKNAEQFSTRKRVSPFREHYAQKFKL